MKSFHNQEDGANDTCSLGAEHCGCEQETKQEAEACACDCHEESTEDTCGCSESCECTDEESCDCNDEGSLFEEDAVVELEDPDSGETFKFYYSDEFEYKDKTYCVLVTESEDNPEYVIARIVEDEDGDSYVESLDEDESDAVYEYYDKILEESLNDEADED